jgi:hypothetical protein
LGSSTSLSKSQQDFFVSANVVLSATGTNLTYKVDALNDKKPFIILLPGRD